jgi:serine/threonine protein kinase
MERKLVFPPFFDKNAQDFIDKLLSYNPIQRLGYSSMMDLREHPFMRDIDFEFIEKEDMGIQLVHYFENIGRPKSTQDIEMEIDEDLTKAIYSKEENSHASSN